MATTLTRRETAEDTLVLTNARLVRPTEIVTGTVAIRGGFIRAIDPGRSALPSALDLDGDLLIPGLIDLHTDSLEKHLQPRAGVLWDGVMAAVAHDAQVAASGITTVFDSLTVGAAAGWDTRADMLEPMIEGLRTAKRQRLLRADHYLHLRCETTHPEIAAMVEPYWDDPLLHLISLMDHTPGQRQQPDLERFRVFYRDKLGKTDDWVDRHIAEMKAKQERYADANRAALAEAAVERDLPLASHDDADEAHVEDAHRLGCHLSEFPTTRAAARHARALGMHVLMGSPNLLRGGSHSGNVAAGDLAEAGLLDTLASDYIPASLLPAAFRLTRAPYDWPLPRAINAVSAVPADAVDMTDRGAIEVGLRADLVRVRVVDDRPFARNVWRFGERVA